MSTSPIIITGAGQRLGYSVALELASTGYNVVCSYRTERETINHLRQQGIVCIKADFSTREGVDGFIQAVTDKYSAIRGVIHNASEWVPESLESEGHDAQLIERMLQIHTVTPYTINQRLIPALLAYSQNGRMADIIHLTDHSASHGSHSHIAYAASKAALHNMTMSYATSLAPRVKVNSIAPSLLMFNGDDTSEYKSKASSKTLLPPSPGVQEGVDAVKYILNSAYVTGHNLQLNGGRHLATGTINSIMPAESQVITVPSNQGKS